MLKKKWGGLTKSLMSTKVPKHWRKKKITGNDDDVHSKIGRANCRHNFKNRANASKHTE
jgi:hypothetical protein